MGILNGAYCIQRGELYLEEGQVGHEDVIKGDPGVDPHGSGGFLGVADGLVGDDLVAEPLAGVHVHALVVLAHEGVDADDGEDEPENETHEKHIENTG